MIEFHSQIDFELKNENTIVNWLTQLVIGEGYEMGQLDYVFCSDMYLHQINVKFLDHDTFTDIISFDYTMGKLVGGEIYISIDRVKENALTYEQDFTMELHRVMAHGVLHLCGYKDKTDEEAKEMRNREDLALDRLLNI